MGAGMVCLALLAAFVWPTPYEYSSRMPEVMGTFQLRVNRFTQSADIRYDGEPRWRRLPSVDEMRQRIRKTRP
jgi:hypothetical protein